MADDIVSLLSKNKPLKDYGEILGAYFSGRNKNKPSSRDRNLLLAKFFMSAKENKMKSNVLQNLEDWKDRKLIQNTELKATYDNQLKLQTKYDKIQSDGISNYYEDEAEIAFNKKVKAEGMASRYNGTNPSANKAKSAWKNDYSNEQYNKFLETYNPDDKDIVRLTSYEKFAEPLLNMNKQDRRKITDPRNLSIVHNVVGKVGDTFGFGSGKDKKLEEDYKTNQELYNEQVKNSTRFATPVPRVSVDTIPLTEEDSILVAGNLIDDELLSYGINSNSELYEPLMDKLYLVPDKDRNVAKVRNTIASGIQNRFVLQSEYAVKEETDILNSNPATVKSLKETGMYDYTLQKNIRDRLELPNIVEDTYFQAKQLTNLVIKISDKTFESEEAKEQYMDDMIKEFTNPIIAKARGLKTKESIVQETSISVGLTTARKVFEEDFNTMAAIRQTALPQEAMELMKNKDPGVYNYIQTNIEDQDITTASAEKLISNSEYGDIIRRYQQDQYNSNITSAVNNLVEYMDVKTNIFSGQPKGIPGYDVGGSGSVVTSTPAPFTRK